LNSSVPSLAVALILSSALLHAIWNSVYKRSGGGLGFMLAYSACALVLIFPVAALSWISEGAQPLSAKAWFFCAGSGLIHFAYFLVLDKAYRSGDMSVVYPVARSTGPVICIVLAILLFAEQPSFLALCGAALIGTAAMVLASGKAADPSKPRGVSVAFALATGVFIGIYTVWDRYAVRELGINIWVFDWLGALSRFVCLLALAWPVRQQAIEKTKTHWRSILFIATVSPLSYVLALYSMKIAPLSYIAPMRESSVLFGALIGSVFLGEGEVAKRMSCALVMAGGLLLLVLN
jgi:drug/metabolite transporter (DMT)-like permease